MRPTARLVGAEHKTVLRVLLRAGERRQRLLDEKMRNLRSRYIQVDETHGYVQVRQKNLDPARHDESAQGERYVFIATDPESKLVPSFVVDARDGSRSDESPLGIGRILSCIGFSTEGGLVAFLPETASNWATVLVLSACFLAESAKPRSARTGFRSNPFDREWCLDNTILGMLRSPVNRKNPNQLSTPVWCG